MIVTPYRTRRLFVVAYGVNVAATGHALFLDRDAALAAVQGHA
jgi:hypothetical protein